MPTRRDTLLGALVLSACAPGATPDIEAPLADDPRLASIEARIGGRVGVAALNTESGAWLIHRADQRFAMCSTFKWLLAAQHLVMAQEAPGWLDEVIQFGAGDLLEYAPVARQHVERGFMSNEEMCEAIVIASDNTCANLLLIPVGGPAGFTQFLREIGDNDTRLDRNEPALNENAPGDPRDTTTPAAMARTLARVLTSEAVLNAASREKLIDWMVACETGRQRLRAGLPADWRAGDKTGTGVNGATNDVALAWPSGRAPIVIASYLSESTQPREALSAAHVEIARIVTETWS